MRSFFFLLAIFTVAWALIFLGSALIFLLIVRLELPNAFVNASAKVAISAVLALIWLWIFMKLRDLYVRRYLRP
jgi:hypothetical protein